MKVSETRAVEGKDIRKSQRHVRTCMLVTDDLRQPREDTGEASGGFWGAASHGPVILAVAVQGFLP